MPAFELVRLRTQVDELIRYFTQPEKFNRMIEDLFIRYGNFALRSPNETLVVVSSYRLNPQVFEYLRVELCRLSNDRPAAAPALVRVLWKEPYLEPKQLASYMLGEIPLNPPEVIEDLLVECVQPSQPVIVQDLMLTNGSRKLRHEESLRWLDQIETWLGNESVGYQVIGLRAMLSVIRDPQFLNLPPLFRMLTPRMAELKPDTQSALAEVLHALSERVPNEVTFFLRQFILVTDTPEMNLRLIRQIIPDLPPEFQKSLERAFHSRAYSQGSE